MEKLNIEMPIVKSCDVNNCGYNSGNQCHAKAITIGDGSNPGCDTFMNSNTHTKEKKRLAGVGACKVSNCRFNQDFECAAEDITVGFVEGRINCETYSPRS